MGGPGFDLTQTDRLLTTTRSVRRRLDLARPVEREVVLECLELAMQAPTGGNLQAWRWLVVDDPGARRGLGQLYRRSWDPYIEAQTERMGASAPPGSTMGRVVDSSSYLAEHIGEVPVHVVPCWLARLPDTPTTFETATLYGSILPAVWSFMLALRSRGLGSAWTTLHLAFEREAEALLGVPHTVTQVGLIPVAYYTGDDFRPGERKDAAAVTYWNGWGRRGEE